MSLSPLASKLKYFTTPELMNLIKSFSAKSPANSFAVVTAVDYEEHKSTPDLNTDGASTFVEPFTMCTLQHLEKTMGRKFTSHGRAASLLSRLSRPAIARKVTFFRPNPPSLPECWVKLSHYCREELISICEDFSAISEENQSDMMALAKYSEEQKEAKRARVVLDHGTTVRVENVENALGYRFADPQILVSALTHPSSHRSIRKGYVFSGLRSDGKRNMDMVASMHLDGPRYMYEGKEFNFGYPYEVARVIKESAMSSEFLARVAVRLGLLENSLHRLSATARKKVGRFEASVEKGEFNVSPPKVLGELTEAVGGSIFTDCNCFEVFYLRWADNLFFQDNPVFVLYDRYKTDNIFVCRMDNPDFYPSVTQKSGVWVVEHQGKILGSGKTIMEAADAANRKEH